MASYNLLNREVEEVYSSQVHEAFSSVDDIFYMPDLIRSRTAAKLYHRIWEICWITPSICATGRTAAGTPVVLYAHVPNFYSDGANIKKTIEEKKLVRGAGVLPREEFTHLLSLEGNGVSVVDYKTLKKSTHGLINLDNALEHPQTLPFLGVSEEEAQAYLKKHKRIYCANIGVHYFDDLADEPLARVLFLGDIDGDYLVGIDLSNDARVLGVPRRASVSAPQRFPLSLAAILADSRDFVPENRFPAWEELVRNKYQ